jgi:uncharacterized repeat protein (TIGR03803 family)
MRPSLRPPRTPSRLTDPLHHRVHIYALAVWCALLFILLALTARAQAQGFTTLYSFSGGSDGAWPYAGVIRDPAGNLYGTASSGGNLNACFDGCGVVYKLDTAGTETVLHSFSGPDGEYPYTPLTRDRAGNIYGTTIGGGSSGYGTVFKIDTAGKETLLYSFGAFGTPYQGLVMDKKGNLYGTTNSSGAYSQGMIFKIDTEGNFSILHSFCHDQPSCADGARPFYGYLLMDKEGNLYGDTAFGGIAGQGVVYKLSKSGTFTLLHSFAGGPSDGKWPYGSVALDKHGNLYGTTYSGGSSNGTIWKLSSAGTETILHSFSNLDGGNPTAGVALDSKGNLYGVTSAGGAYGYGTVYKLNARGKLTVLHTFDPSDGTSPYGEVLRGGKGTLYGTTLRGVGSYLGTVWSTVNGSTKDGSGVRYRRNPSANSQRTLPSKRWAAPSIHL